MHSALVDLAELRRIASAYAAECGQRVRDRREALKLDQADLAELIGVPFQTISKVERGQIIPREYLRYAFAICLGCDPSKLWPPKRRAELPLPKQQRAA